MSIKQAFAAVLRAIRVTRGIPQDRLADAMTATHLSHLETAKASLTLGKLEALCKAYGVSPATLLLLAQSVHEKESPADLLERVRVELTEFDAIGGTTQLAKEIVDGQLVMRRGGKRFDEEKLASVLRCKAQGKSQSEAARELGLSTSTVHDLWKRDIQQ